MKPDKSVNHAAACWPQTGSTPLSLFWVRAMVLKVACRRLTTRLELKDTSPLYFQFHAVSADTPQSVCIEKKQCMAQRSTSSKLYRQIQGDNFFVLRVLFT
jgi:hypothetical protein